MCTAAFLGGAQQGAQDSVAPNGSAQRSGGLRSLFQRPGAPGSLQATGTSPVRIPQASEVPSISSRKLLK